MHISIHIVLFLSLILCSSCGVKRNETAVHTDSLHLLHGDSLQVSQRLRHDRNWQVDWKETVLSAPDSSGQQFIQIVRTATTRAYTSTRQAADSHNSHHTLLSKKEYDERKMTEEKKTISFLPAPSLIVFSIITGLLLIYLYKKRL